MRDHYTVSVKREHPDLYFARWFVKQNVYTDTLNKVFEVWEILKYIKIEEYYFH